MFAGFVARLFALRKLGLAGCARVGNASIKALAESSYASLTSLDISRAVRGARAPLSRRGRPRGSNS